MKVNIKSNIKSFTKAVSAQQKKQIPFATAGAINDTLFDVKKHIGNETFPNAFPDRKNKSFAKRFPFRVAKANKRTLTGALFDSANFTWLSRQQSGGTKKPKRTSVAVPQHGRGKVRRTTRGVKQTPTQLLANKGQFFSGVPKGRGEDKAGIYRRLGKDGRSKLVMMFAYESRTKVKKAFMFFRDANKVSNKRLPINFSRRFERAIRSAR